MAPMTTIRTKTFFAVLVCVSACRAERAPAELPSGVHAYDVSEAVNLYELGRSEEARRAVELGSFPNETKDDLLLRMMVADRVIGRAAISDRDFRGVLDRALQHRSVGEPTSRQRYVLAVALSQQGDEAHTRFELQSICAAPPKDAIECHERELAVLKENAMLMSSVLDSRILRGVSSLLKREVGDGPQIEASQIYGLYFDTPSSARDLYQNALHPGMAKEAFCSAVHSTQNAAAEDLFRCR